MRITWHASELCFAPAISTPCAQRCTSSRPSNAAIMSTAATSRYDVVIMLACMPVKLCISDLLPIVFRVFCYTAEGSFCTAHTGSNPLGGCCTCHVLDIRGRTTSVSRGPSCHLGRQETFALQQASPLSHLINHQHALELQQSRNYKSDAIWRHAHACRIANVLAAVAQQHSYEVGTSAAPPRSTSMPRRSSALGARSGRPPVIIVPPLQLGPRRCWPLGGGTWHTPPPFPWRAGGWAKPPGTPRQSAAPPHVPMPGPPASHKTENTSFSGLMLHNAAVLRGWFQPT